MVNMSVRISERAVTKVVAAATASVPGTTGFSTSMGRITGRGFPRFDVQLDPDADTATIEAFIAVTWPCPVGAVAAAVRDHIIEHVGVLCGIEVLACNVVVGPVLPSKERITKESLALPALQPAPVPAPPSLRLQPITVGGRR